MIPHPRSHDEEPPLTPDESAELEPDPARSYERAKPQKEYGDDRLDAEPNRSKARPDEMIRAVHNAHDGRQINDESGTDAADANPLNAQHRKQKPGGGRT